MPRNERQKEEHKGKGHRKRLRERFLQSDLDGFLDYEIVELLLTLGTPRKDCKSVAKEVIERFGGLRGALEASPEELQQIRGIGRNNYFGLKLFQAVSKCLSKERIPKKITLDSSQIVADYLKDSIGREQKEHFVALYLNSRNQLIFEDTVSIGTIDTNLVHPREVFKEAIKSSATQIIIAHNHPSGDPTPSPEDIALTRRLQEASRIFDIELLDHLIISNNGFTSLKKEKLM